MATYLEDRLLADEEPQKRLWALKSTVNWMRCLALIVNDQGFTPEELNSRYTSLPRRKKSDSTDNNVLGGLLMAEHYSASLQQLANAPTLDPWTTTRPAIISWFYVIHQASSAMINCQNHCETDSHRTVINQWHTTMLTSRNPVPVPPFDLHLNDIEEGRAGIRIKELRNGRNHRLRVYPETVEQAWGGIFDYLSGSAKFIRKPILDRVRAKHNIDRFNTNANKAIRDKALDGKIVNFVEQAYRYRTKANYRDSLYLTHGRGEVHLAKNQRDETVIGQYLHDLDTVAAAYLRMAASYASHRVAAATWTAFVDDLKTNSRIANTQSAAITEPKTA